MDDVRGKLAPVETEIRKRLGNFIMAEDEQTLEGVVLAELTKRGATLAIAETFTSGQIAARIGPLPAPRRPAPRPCSRRTWATLWRARQPPGDPPKGE